MEASPHRQHTAPSRLGHHGMEHRWGRRIACRAAVQISAPAGALGGGRMRDVSSSGAFVETTLALPLFATIAVTMLRDDGHRGTRLDACVVRRATDGIGIEWVETPAGAICPVLGCAEGCAHAAPRG